MILTRRKSMMLAGGALLAGQAVTQAPHAKGAVPNSFDPENPSDNLNGFVKLMADVSGKPVWLTASGRIYALRDGEMPVPICGVQGLRYVKFTPDGDGYRMGVRDWGYYTDYTSGELLEEFSNPFTGETNRPAPLLTSYFTWGMGPDGQHLENFTGEAWLIGKPFRLPWTFQNGKTFVTLELLVKYGNGGHGGEWVNLHSNTEDFLDETKSSAPMRFSWTGYSPWMRWLDMGDRPGRTLWNSNGSKSSDLDGLDPNERAIYDRYFPGSLDAPETYAKSGGQTSTEE